MIKWKREIVKSFYTLKRKKILLKKRKKNLTNGEIASRVLSL